MRDDAVATAAMSPRARSVTEVAWTIYLEMTGGVDRPEVAVRLRAGSKDQVFLFTERMLLSLLVDLTEARREVDWCTRFLPDPDALP